VTLFRQGDRVRVETTGDDGFPIVRYGFVGGLASGDGPLVVMLDGEITGEIVDSSEVQPVMLTTVELCLRGTDLVDDPELRRGLVALWRAEADTAGLDVDGVRARDEGHHDGNGCWTLADLVVAGDSYVVRAITPPMEPGVVRIRADHVF
jgi:hypothetical protein